MGGPGEGPELPPPPPELMRYKNVLLLLSAGYGILLILQLAVGALNNALNDFFVLLAALCISLKSQQCWMQCVIPFGIFAMMAVIFDLINTITTLAQPYPGAGNFLSTSCPVNKTLIMSANTTVYTADDNSYTLLKGTKVLSPLDFCNVAWMLANLAGLLDVFLDVCATFVGWKMFKVYRESAPPEGAMPLGGFPPPQTGGPGPGMGGMGGGGGNPRVFGGGGAAGGRGGGPAQQQGFQPFQGQGQSLNG
eukprot:gnl/TRDRNA2_/TRDRNA2_87383_c0_seq1.p1 gnl/TRDRNA2_/TRDRNA2_87383_c0~~gnl/TRDRNA2_/TRDRNA2_87383_c0_seq1.p1  ORF type:complete len:287 (-),score=51.79 gnl/TRDRNA2_/TRDRNA2_87383_c0_seq1:46-795(-)